MRNRKNQVIIGGIQKEFPLGIHPEFFRKPLAHRAVPIPAGVVMEFHMSAFPALGNGRSKSPRPASHDVESRFRLPLRRFVSFKIRGIKAGEDILNGELNARHHSLRSECQRGF